MIAAVIPVKRFELAKSRLAAVLTSEERRELVESLLAQTLRAVSESGCIDRVIVVTSNQLDLAGDVQVLPDPGELNEALAHGVRFAAEQGAEAIVLLPADLPLITGEDVCALTSPLACPPRLSIARTRDGGTGGIGLRPLDGFRPAFGPASFSRHIEYARRAGREITVVDRRGLSFDLDTPVDLAAVDQARVGRVSTRRQKKPAGCRVPKQQPADPIRAGEVV